MNIENIIIIGSGPAGLTAGIYAARAGLSPLVIEGFAVGGQLVSTPEVENFPGFAEPVSGMELMTSMRRQAERAAGAAAHRPRPRSALPIPRMPRSRHPMRDRPRARLGTRWTDAPRQPAVSVFLLNLWNQGLLLFFFCRDSYCLL